jgi:hypothetical protein
MCGNPYPNLWGRVYGRATRDLRSAGFAGRLNLHRRHLNESQRAMVAAKIANAKDGNPRFQANNATESIDSVVSKDDAAKLLNVSRPSIQRAAAVREQGAPELVAAVEKGEVSVSAAAEVVDLPHEEQRELLKGGRRAVASRAAAARAPRKSKATMANTYTRTCTGRKAPAAVRGATGTFVGIGTRLVERT